ncbi:MAG: helix-turn-helix transcriptional regulator [Bacilli bacterium]|nr:helix-turn-helix transcriptional regulator [Bacilli bacterium]
MDQEKIGDLIKKIRKKHNLTQAEFAEKYGVTYQAVSKWENGKNIPDVSLLKQMSKDFNIDINDMLEGNLNQKRKSKLFILLIILITITALIFINMNKSESFSFKTISSNCSNFNITGSIAYNNKKSSIYISDINYCGKEDNNKYTKIECILYEKNINKENVINKMNYNKEPITLNEFLKTLNIKIDEYERTCKKYSKNSLFLKIKAQDEEGKIKKHVIPLSLEDNC